MDQQKRVILIKNNDVANTISDNWNENICTVFKWETAFNEAKNYVEEQYALHALPDLLIIDPFLIGKESSGREFAEVLKLKYGIPFLFITQVVEDEILLPLLQSGAEQVLVQPNDLQLRLAVLNVFRNQALQQSEMQHKASGHTHFFVQLIEHLPLAIAIHSGNRILFANKACSLLTAYSEKELLELYFLDLVHPDDHSQLKKLADSRLKNEMQGSFYDLRVVDKEKHIHWVEMYVHSIDYMGNRAVLVAGTDITSRKYSEIALEQALQRAEESKEIKNLIFQKVSHELRTPMNGILGFSDLLQNTVQDPIAKDYARNIYDSSKRLMGTLTSLIDASGLNKKRIRYNPVLCNISHSVGRILKRLAPAFDQRNNNLEFHLPEEELIAFTDEALYNRVLEHLLANANKFTVSGTVSVKLYVQEDEEPYFVTEITDTGIGFDMENLDKIVEEFRQESEGNTRLHEGLGLGLSISYKMVQLMGGRIHVDSEVGKGAHFKVVLPVNKLDKPKTIVKRKPFLSSRQDAVCILLVEDDDISIDYTRACLNFYQVDVAMKASDAIEMVKKKQYQAILMDIDLGFGMSGLDAVAQLRKMPNYKEIPIAAVTANALEQQKEEFLMNGCTDFIAKPYTVQAVQEFVANLLNE